MEPDNGRLAIILVAPVLPGQSEAWRRFVQEMTGLRRHEYEASRRRLGVASEWIWLVEARSGVTAVIAVRAAQPEQIMAGIAASDQPFDHWYCQQLLALLRLDKDQLHANPTPELLWGWQGRRL